MSKEHRKLVQILREQNDKVERIIAGNNLKTHGRRPYGLPHVLLDPVHMAPEDRGAEADFRKFLDDCKMKYEPFENVETTATIERSKEDNDSFRKKMQEQDKRIQPSRPIDKDALATLRDNVSELAAAVKVLNDPRAAIVMDQSLASGQTVLQVAGAAGGSGQAMGQLPGAPSSEAQDPLQGTAAAQKLRDIIKGCIKILPRRPRDREEVSIDEMLRFMTSSIVPTPTDPKIYKVPEEYDYNSETLRLNVAYRLVELTQLPEGPDTYTEILESIRAEFEKEQQDRLEAAILGRVLGQEQAEEVVQPQFEDTGLSLLDTDVEMQGAGETAGAAGIAETAEASTSDPEYGGIIAGIRAQANAKWNNVRKQRAFRKGVHRSLQELKKLVQLAPDDQRALDTVNAGFLIENKIDDLLWNKSRDDGNATRQVSWTKKDPQCYGQYIMSHEPANPALRQAWLDNQRVEACYYCCAHRIPCFYLDHREDSIIVLPLPADKRGDYTPAELGYWWDRIIDL